MSGWEQDYGFGGGTQQGFYNPGASGSVGTSYDIGVSAQIPADSSYPSYMTPDYSAASADVYGGRMDQGIDEFSNEPPLLEELGINPEYIMQKTLSVLNPFRATKSEIAGDSDFAGPLVFCLTFGSILLLTGKIHFNYIYGIGALGCVGMYGLLTLMNVTTPVAFGVIVSVLGYCILPIVGLAGLGVMLSLQGLSGSLLAVLAVVWSSVSASNLFVTAFDMHQQQLLVAYPCSMLYAVFALITVF